jgi:hypothetical protein
LDSRAAALKGGDTGRAIVPGNTKESLLIDAINYGELYQMPPKSRLPAAEIGVLTAWIERGAPWPDDRTASSGSESSTLDRVKQKIAKFDLAKRKSEHWCWQPISSPTVPQVANPQLAIHNPIDAFILARLEAAGLSPAPPADARTLIRRAYFDLIGLPPSAEELERWLAVAGREDGEGASGGEGECVNAYGSLIDRLLASPRFGERWGRHWLDLVRYAESRGHEFDYDIPNAFEYRDYIIRALNADLPYDQFVVEHVAGDLLPSPRLHPADHSNESIIATGFWFLGEWCHSPVDIRKDECDRIDNMIDCFSKAFLGVTVACARCHDHKFDAISQRDYYALAGYLQSSSYRLTRFETWQKDRELAKEFAALEAKYRPKIAAAVAAAVRPKLGAMAGQLAADLKTRALELGVLKSDAQGGEVVVDYRGGVSPGEWMSDGPTWCRLCSPGGTLGRSGAFARESKRCGPARRLDSRWSNAQDADIHPEIRRGALPDRRRGARPRGCRFSLDEQRPAACGAAQGNGRG